MILGILSLLNIISGININYFNHLDEYNKYLSNYNKDYNDSEYWYRYHIYDKNMDYINLRNQNLTSYKLGENNFTDISLNEFKQNYLNLKISVNQSVISNYNFTNKSIPENIDWRANGLVTNVKNQ